ncbi:hypothetical protein B0H19DRAFT_1134021 [Mycena capillaripes]|nr:hypothetical protein B0H19DRAFT_1134021 [Mycena capillaripes]
MVRSLSFLILALSAAFVAGQTSPLSQCGGIDYEGPTGSLSCGSTGSLTRITFRQPVQLTTLAPKSTPGTTSACPTTNSGLLRC